MRWDSTRFTCWFLSMGLSCWDQPDAIFTVWLVALRFCRYTGAACESCLASFYPSSRSCTPQYISGRTIFDPVETSQALTGWALALLIMGTLLAAVVLATMAWALWQWLVQGVPPKTQLNTALGKGGALLQHWWRAVASESRRSRMAAAVGKKYLLEDQLEMTGSGALKHKGDGPVVQEVSQMQGAPT